MTASATVTATRADALLCAACGTALGPQEAGLRCSDCGRSFGSVAGIPDLRLDYPDPYLSLDDDLAHAAALAARADELGFPDLLREHWERLGKRPELAERFVAQDLAAPSKVEAVLDAIERARGAPLTPADRVLEVGCGTAALAAAASRRGAAVVATDVSMRWLVLAGKRLVEEGAAVELVCSDAERPVFGPETFDVVVASDVIEHVARPDAFLAGCHHVLRPGRLLFLATPNRFSLALEPHVRLWGVGVLPRRAAKRYVEAVRKAPYDHVRLLSARELRQLLAARGFDALVVPPEIPPASRDLYRGVEGGLVRAYNALRRIRAARAALLAVGPFFHVFARKRV